MAGIYEIEKFDGKGDFSLWRMKMRAFLTLQKVDKALEDPSKLPPTITDQEKIEMNDSAFCILILNLSDNILRKVVNAKSAAEVWKKLEDLYLKKPSPAKIGLLEKFFGFKMDPSKELDENLAEFNRICLDLADTGEEFTDEHRAVILLNSLPESYIEVKNALKFDNETLTSNTVLSALKSWELKMMEEEEIPTIEEILTVWYKPPDQNMEGNRNKSRSQSGTSENSKKCCICDKEGHLKRDCPENDESSNRNREQKSSTRGRDQQWVMSTGCPFHITFHRHWFVDFKSVEGGGSVVTVANDEHRVQGIGSVQLKLHDGTIKTLTNVMYVPGLRRNYLCLFKLTNKGHQIDGTNGSMNVYKGSKLKMKGTINNGMYILQASTVIPAAAGSMD